MSDRISIENIIIMHWILCCKLYEVRVYSCRDYYYY